MRAKWFFLVTCVLAGFLGGYAVYTQRALQTAQTVYLKIEPVDPRALLSGDYMQLNYDFERPYLAEQGQALVLQVGENKVLYLPEETQDKEPLIAASTSTQEHAPAAAPQTVSIKTLGPGYRVPHQFYFQEGTGKKYENAVYAKAAVLPNGSILLLGLTDKNFNLL